jgi:hypothetical protein
LAPDTSAAFTKSRSDQDRVLARVMRARIGTLTMPSTRVMTTTLRRYDVSSSVLASTVTSDSASTRAGMARNTLTKVDRTVSRRPLK